MEIIPREEQAKSIAEGEVYWTSSEHQRALKCQVYNEKRVHYSIRIKHRKTVVQCMVHLKPCLRLETYNFPDVSQVYSQTGTLS